MIHLYEKHVADANAAPQSPLSPLLFCTLFSRPPAVVCRGLLVHRSNPLRHPPSILFSPSSFSLPSICSSSSIPLLLVFSDLSLRCRVQDERQSSPLPSSKTKQSSTRSGGGAHCSGQYTRRSHPTGMVQGASSWFLIHVCIKVFLTYRNGDW